VNAVEIDEYLCECLVETVRANGLSGTIEILPGDARDIDLPSAVDVVIAELIEFQALERSPRALVWSGGFAAGPHQPEVSRSLTCP
jgi:predicted RNA methylase